MESHFIIRGSRDSAKGERASGIAVGGCESEFRNRGGVAGKIGIKVGNMIRSRHS